MRTGRIPPVQIDDCTWEATWYVDGLGTPRVLFGDGQGNWYESQEDADAIDVEWHDVEHKALPVGDQE